jgi:hypothetical protein
MSPSVQAAPQCDVPFEIGHQFFIASDQSDGGSSPLSDDISSSGSMPCSRAQRRLIRRPRRKYNQTATGPSRGP